MASNLKVFVCEFITGGGLYNAPLPASLVREGEAMLAGLLAELSELPDVSLVVARDPRLPLPAFPAHYCIPESGEDIHALWQRAIDQADAAWVIAPESGGVLEKIAVMAGTKSIGCEPEAIRIAASKLATSRHLAAHGVPAVPTFLSSEPRPPAAAWVAKPDDGVGCDGMRRFEDAAALEAWLADGRMGSHVVQPWLPGEAASLSMLCRAGRAQLLSCNRQLIEVADGAIQYRGSVLNAMTQHWGDFQDIASRVAQALPGLRGYVGIDVVVDGDRVTVIEINPRLTTSYAGLSRAIGRNAAGLVLDLHYNGHFIGTNELQRNLVEVKIDG
jgi:predicted ATP-grasp superfamily ATP-dependent carboligase